MGRTIEPPAAQDTAENVQDPFTRGMALFEVESFNQECELVLDDERIRRARKLRRDQVRRYRERRKQKEAG